MDIKSWLSLVYHHFMKLQMLYKVQGSWCSCGWGETMSELWPPVDVSVWNPSRMILTGKTEELRERPVPVPLCPPQIPHELSRATRVRGRWLTACTMALPVQGWINCVLQCIWPFECSSHISFTVTVAAFIWRLKEATRKLNQKSQQTKCLPMQVSSTGVIPICSFYLMMNKITQNLTNVTGDQN
jgi:hypothetical protein